MSHCTQSRTLEPTQQTLAEEQDETGRDMLRQLQRQSAALDDDEDDDDEEGL